MEINSYKFSQLFQWLQFICTKQMHEFIFYSYFFSAISKFFIGKLTLKNKFENRFSKPKTGFRFSNRKPDFRFSINIPTQRCSQSSYDQREACRRKTHCSRAANAT